MTDPNATTSDSPRAAPVPARRKYARERNAVGAVFFAVTGGVIVNGAIEIWKETYRAATVPAPYASCSEGVRHLHDDFATVLATEVTGPDGTVPRHPFATDPTANRLEVLDEQLRAMRPVCESEGREARAAYDALTLWRHRAQDFARMEDRMLTPAAQRALAYHSPGDHSNHRGQGP